MGHTDSQIAGNEWVTFPGGELEGKRPKTLCPACREALKRAATGQGEAVRSRTLCFECYRAGLDRERALKAAGTLDTASDARFQYGLPFEPVNRPRLARLKEERIEFRAASSAGVGRYAHDRRQAQIAARHALEQIAAGLKARALTPADIHAAELQLPESWLPFVVSR